MVLSLADVIVMAGVGVLAWRRGRDQRVSGVRSARGFRVAGLVPLGLQVLILLLFGVGEMTSGDPSGAAHLLQVAVVALVGLLAWMRPLEGGLGLFLAGLVSAMFEPGFGLISPAMMILAAPQIVAGGLFFVAGMLARRTRAPQADQEQ